MSRIQVFSLLLAAAVSVSGSNMLMEERLMSSNQLSSNQLLEIYNDPATRQSIKGRTSCIIDTFDVVKYVPDTELKIVDECDSELLNIYKAQFSALIADSGRKYLGHIVADDYKLCFVNVRHEDTAISLKTCLEYSSRNESISFSYRAADGACTQYRDWREHKYRYSHRGTEETMFYLQENEPELFDPCHSVTMDVECSYTATGGVMLTVIFLNNVCICDITRITIEYGKKKYEIATPGNVFIYPADESWYCQNETTILAYNDHDIVTSLFQFVPADTL